MIERSSADTSEVARDSFRTKSRYFSPIEDSVAATEAIMDSYNSGNKLILLALLSWAPWFMVEAEGLARFAYQVSVWVPLLIIWNIGGRSSQPHDFFVFMLLPILCAIIALGWQIFEVVQSWADNVTALGFAAIVASVAVHFAIIWLRGIAGIAFLGRNGD